MKRKREPDGESPAGRGGRTWLVALASVAAIALLGAWQPARPDTSGTVVAAGGSGGSASDADETRGEIRVQLEAVEGYFIEGFEIGLRFETGTGEPIASMLWSDVVASATRTDLDAYYDTVLTQPVPAGAVTVRAEVNIGAGPGPSVPDLSGDLPCQLTVDVEPGGLVTVEVSFDDPTDCLRLVPGSGTTRSTATTTEPVVTTAPVDTTAPATTLAPGTETAPTKPGALTMGVPYYVDVDLQCRAFELSGVWVLDEGDMSGWQPPGERHEGGMFTLDGPDHGRFAGDANGEKTATFRLLPADEPPSCIPVPRPPG